MGKQSDFSFRPYYSMPRAPAGAIGALGILSCHDLAADSFDKCIPPDLPLPQGNACIPPDLPLP